MHLDSKTPICDIARAIKADWKNVSYAAKPYLDAMVTLYDIDSKYYEDSAKSIIIYFLANAQTWRGETAKKIKKHLNFLIK